MQITRVELRNIKNHAEAEWTFNPGVIAIRGPNGSGKTTILEAIAWALFDHLDYKREDFVKRGTKKGQVVVGFISALDEREYIVQRDTAGGYFIYDPTTKTRIVEQKNQVRPWLCQHIGVDLQTDLGTLFKTTIGVPQGAFTYDFTLRPSDRKNVFDRILKVDEYRAASDNLRATLKHIEGQVAEADRGIAEAEGQLKIYDETKREFDLLTSRERELSSAHSAAESESARLAAEVAEGEELRRRIDEQGSTRERLEVRLRVTRDRLGAAREAAEQARAAAAIVEQARAGYESYLQASERYNALDRERQARDALRSQLSEVEREQFTISAQITRCEERLAEIATARAELSQIAPRLAEQEQLERQLAELRESRGAQQSLTRSLAQLDEELERLRKRFATVSRDLEKAESKRAEAERAAALEEERTALEQKIKEIELARQSRDLKRAHLEGLGRELGRIEEEMGRKQSELARLESLSAAASGAKALESDHQQQNERLARLRAEVARDAEMVAALESGGICPLLSEKCLNLKPGESLDNRFRAGIEARRAEIATLEAKIPEIASEWRKAQRAAAESARLPQVQKEVERLSQAKEARRQEIAALEAEIAALTVDDGARLLELEKRRAQIETELRAAREAQRIFAQCEGLRHSLEAIKDEGGEKRQARDEIASRIAALGDVEQSLRGVDAALAALGDPRSRAAALKAQIDRADEWQRALAKGEKKLAEVVERHGKITAGLERYVTLDEELAAATHARAVNEKDYRSYIANEQNAATVEAREREAAEIEAEAGKVETALAEAQEEHARLSAQYDAERQARARAALDDAQRRATQLATQIEHTREQIDRLKKQLAALDEVRQRMREYLNAHQKYVRLGETADFIREILQKAAPYIIDSYVFSISLEANQLYREITGRHDVTLRWTREYEITLEEEGRERPFGNLSGGEQMAAALAVRLALLKELSEIDLAFFDEPTTNMDEERRRNLAQQIGRIKDFQQLFVISHDDSFEGFTEQVITLGENG